MQCICNLLVFKAVNIPFFGWGGFVLGGGTEKKYSHYRSFHYVLLFFVNWNAAARLPISQDDEAHKSSLNCYYYLV